MREVTSGQPGWAGRSSARLSVGAVESKAHMGHRSMARRPQLDELVATRTRVANHRHAGAGRGSLNE